MLESTIFEQIQKKLVNNSSIWITNESLYDLFILPNINIFNDDIRVFEYSLLNILSRENSYEVFPVVWSLETWSLEKILWYILLRTKKEIIINFSKLDIRLFNETIMNFIENYVLKKWISMKIITADKNNNIINVFKKLNNCKLKIIDSSQIWLDYMVSDWIDFGISTKWKWKYIYIFNWDKWQKEKIEYLVNLFEKNFRN